MKPHVPAENLIIWTVFLSLNPTSVNVNLLSNEGSAVKRIHSHFGRHVSQADRWWTALHSGRQNTV
jgi:hypothetical protein